MYYFSRFSKNLTNQALFYCEFERKIQFIGNFEKVFKNILKKIARNALF